MNSRIRPECPAIVQLREEVERLKKQLQKKTARIRIEQNEWRKRGTR